MASTSYSISKILGLFFLPLLHLFFPLIGVSILILIAKSWLPAQMYFFEGFILTVLFLLVFTHQAQYVFRHWFKERKLFSDAEHYTILIILAIYVSALFGALNYSILQFNSSSFFADESFIKNEHKQKLRIVANEIDQSNKKIEAARGIISYLQSRPEIAFTKSRTYAGIDWNLDTISLYKINLPDEDPVLIFKEAVPLNTSGEPSIAKIFSVEARKDGFTFKIPDTYAASLTIFIKEEIAKEEILKIFLFTAEQEQVNLKTATRYQEVLNNEAQSEFNAVGVPLYIFIYQSVMSMLGSDPGYLKPANFLTRSIAFLYSAFKFVFFSIFVALIVLKRWGHSSEEASSPKQQVE